MYKLILKSMTSRYSISKIDARCNQKGTSENTTAEPQRTKKSHPLNIQTILGYLPTLYFTKERFGHLFYLHQTL